MDLKSILGYANGSPFMGNPYLDIETPEGLITMENTPIDLLGVDNLGNTKKMKAGRKNPYKFEGDVVREIPMRNPYQQGGLTGLDYFNFLFDDDEQSEPEKKVPTAPATTEVAAETEMPEMQGDMSEYYNFSQSRRRGNPYRAPAYIADAAIQSSGQFGNQNVGQHGRTIYSELSQDLGYQPIANSIYRSKEQNDALIAKGLPAVKNSYHLTGDAIDLKPSDWHRLTNEQQLYYKSNYDVVQHNGHYHIEPK